jgi:RNA polymerase sigma-70 factor (ECF subfamily)
MSSCSLVDSIAQRYDPSAMGDKLLVAAAQAGQEWAFTELCSRNSRRVFRSIYRVTRNHEDAEDALQDSLMKAFQHLNKFDGRSSFATWLTRIGINSALMILRKKRRGFEISMDATEEGGVWQTLQIADHSADPEQQYAGRERSVHLKRAIGALPNALRVVVERAQFREDSTQQIAREMGISIPAAKSRMARAKHVLRKSMVSAPRKVVTAS